MAKTIEYYRALPYRRRVRMEDDGSGQAYYVAYIDELDGLEADGDTHGEALANLAAAFDDYLSAMIEWDADIPEPTPWPASMGLEVPAAGRPPGSVTVEKISVITVERPTPPDAEWMPDFRVLTDQTRLQTQAT